MRVIKFRGKRIDNGEWVYGDLLQWNNNMVEILTHDTVKPLLSVSVLPETVGQFTGLYDNTKWENATEQQKSYAIRNAKINNTTPESEWKGVEIYEGDIILIPPCQTNKEIKGDVQYDDKRGIFFIKSFFSGAGFSLDFTPNIEIIGNIHEEVNNVD